MKTLFVLFLSGLFSLQAFAETRYPVTLQGKKYLPDFQLSCTTDATSYNDCQSFNIIRISKQGGEERILNHSPVSPDKLKDIKRSMLEYFQFEKNYETSSLLLLTSLFFPPLIVVYAFALVSDLGKNMIKGIEKKRARRKIERFFQHLAREKTSNIVLKPIVSVGLDQLLPQIANQIDD